jgi:hypothetical protein
LVKVWAVMSFLTGVLVGYLKWAPVYHTTDDPPIPYQEVIVYTLGRGWHKAFMDPNGHFLNAEDGKRISVIYWTLAPTP